MLLAFALLAAAQPDAAAALRAYSLRAPMFYETEVRAFGALADNDGSAQVLGGAGVGVAVIRIVTPPATAMASSWTALRAGTGARLAMGGISTGANWRGYVLGAAAAPQVVLGSGLHAAWVRAEMHLDRVALEGPKEPQLRVSLALQAPVGYPETLVALGVGIAWY